jgi:general stress protein 26
MHAFRIDDDFTVWYCCGASSNKVRQIRKCPKVCVTFWEAGKDLRVLGSAELLTDRQTRHQMWQEEWKSFFRQGRDDPDYCLIKVTPDTVEYRDADKHGHSPQTII